MGFVLLLASLKGLSITGGVSRGAEESGLKVEPGKGREGRCVHCVF